MPSLPHKYLEQAQHDLEGAEAMSKNRGFEDWVFWMAFQSVELALKCVLIALGNKNTKGMGHQLPTLLSNLPPEARGWADPWSKAVREMWDQSNKIDPYPVEQKEKETGNHIYKRALQNINEPGLQKHLQTARIVVKSVQEILPRLEKGLKEVFA